MIKRTPQEIADFFGCYVVQSKEGLWYMLNIKPEVEGNNWIGNGKYSFGLDEGLISISANHDWTHLYEPRLSGTDTHEERMENARITHPENKPNHASEVFIYEEYTIISNPDLPILCRVINEMMQEGWKLLGGVAVEHIPTSDGYATDRSFFYQAMVRGL